VIAWHQRLLGAGDHQERSGAVVAVDRHHSARRDPPPRMTQKSRGASCGPVRNSTVRPATSRISFPTRRRCAEKSRCRAATSNSPQACRSGCGAADAGRSGGAGRRPEDLDAVRGCGRGQRCQVGRQFVRRLLERGASW
jgi:hypothetical protein